MDLKGFVRIEAPLNELEVSVGTGYRVRPDRILTAAHVVGVAEEVEVFFPGSPNEPFPAKVLWRSSGSDLDAALLEIAPGVGEAIAAAVLADGPLAQTADWESRGFPLADSSPNSTGLSGKVYAFLSTAIHLEVTIEAPPAKVTDWQGISGAPVFVNRTLVGVLQRAPKKYDGQRLRGTPVLTLRGTPGFLEELGESIRTVASRETVSKELKVLLEGDELARQALLRVVHDPNLTLSVTWRTAASQASAASALAEGICETDVIEAARAFNFAHLDLVERAKSLDAVNSGKELLLAARTIRTILERVVPGLVAYWVNLEVPDRRGGLLSLPCKTKPFFEVFAAAIDRRPVRYREETKFDSEPTPEARVELPAFESGISREQKAWDLLYHINKSLPPEVRGTNAVLSSRGLPSPQQFAEAQRQVNRRIELLASEDGTRMRRYLILDVPDRDECVLIADLLQEYLPSLWLLTSIGGDSDREDELFLRMMLILRREIS